MPKENLENVLEIFQSTLDRFVPYKHKKVRYNNNPFMTKQIRKEIMVKSELRNELINLERQKTGKNTNNKETNVSPF